MFENFRRLWKLKPSKRRFWSGLAVVAPTLLKIGATIACRVGILRGEAVFEFLVIAVVALNVWADFTDRRAASRSDVYALALWTTIAQFLLVVPLIGLVSKLTASQFAICGAVGAFSAGARISWYRALTTSGEKLSRLAPFSRISSVMALAMAVLVLGEAPGPSKLGGALIMVIGAFMMSWRGPVGSLRQYLALNQQLVQVTIFAASTASISVFYRYMGLAGVSIVTTYFFLKLTQLSYGLLHAMWNRYLVESYAAIVDLPLFVQARTLQTAAAMLYIFVLRQLDLSQVEPIAAASAPLMYLAVEKFSDRRARERDTLPNGVPETAAKHQSIRNAGLIAIIVGIFLFVRG